MAVPIQENVSILEDSGGNRTTMSRAHVASGTSRHVIAVVFFYHATTFVSAVTATYDGNSMTQEVAVSNLTTTQVFIFSFLNPPTGSRTFACSWNTASRSRAVIVSYTGVRQSPNPLVDTSVANGTASVSNLDVDSAGPVMVIDGIMVANDPITVGGSPQVQINKVNMINDTGTSEQGGQSDPTTMTWTWASDAFAHAGYSFTGLSGINRVSTFFSKMRDFHRDLKLGLLPPDQLRQRYGELLTI